MRPASRWIGRPVDIYDRPATTYVARFLGSPMMNIFAMADSALTVAQRPGAAQVGVRPEDLRVTPVDTGTARVTDVEPLGGYTVVSLLSGSTPLRALMRGQPAIKVGTNVALTCDKVQYFDAAGVAMGG